ncbi:acyl-CoA dehydrogenase family protein [Mycolicibacterium alvei]|uniref:Acyl-CoA dehydrogenase n=1 Tax=Mycolicibacterium alvei TaxID=67081 RepID=A0A6N4UXP6_9MYCO|nr:acyl-CoA dehydrogenase family protein [Mycolicibacterium alvei]MCV7001550.1 acyl-CoA dehydrogenase family protein [Mycolicibacterium alvei]BBX28457.1 acyl-CoA dehydrogenase [Mycolicibacterium alvei]
MPLLTDADRMQFRTWVRDALEQLAPLDQTRILAESGRRDDPALHGSLAELGMFGLATPEEYGGGDVGAAGLAIFLMEAGRCLLPAPYLSTAVLAPTAIRWAGAEKHFAELLRGIAAGRARVALAVSPSGDTALRAARDGQFWQLTGAYPAVLEADVADWLIVAAETDTGPGLFVVDRHDAGVHIAALHSVDVARPVAAVTFTSAPGVALGDLDSAAALQARLQDLVRLAIAADAVGGAQRLLDMSVEYAKARVQFGRPIGSFQTIKHRCADLFVAVQAATAAVEGSFDHLDQTPGTTPVSVAVAAVCAHEANWQAVRTAMQIHGGLALTWEHEVQLYLKRMTASQHLLGNPDHELARLTDLVLAANYDVVREIIG